MEKYTNHKYALEAFSKRKYNPGNNHSDWRKRILLAPQKPHKAVLSHHPSQK